VFFGTFENIPKLHFIVNRVSKKSCCLTFLGAVYLLSVERFSANRMS